MGRVDIEIVGKLKTYGIVHKLVNKAIKRERRVEGNKCRRRIPFLNVLSIDDFESIA